MLLRTCKMLQQWKGGKSSNQLSGCGQFGNDIAKGHRGRAGQRKWRRQSKLYVEYGQPEYRNAYGYGFDNGRGG